MVLEIVQLIYFWVTHYPKTLKLKTTILCGCNAWVVNSGRPWLSGLFLIHGGSSWAPDDGGHNSKMTCSFKSPVPHFSLVFFFPPAHGILITTLCSRGLCFSQYDSLGVVRCLTYCFVLSRARVPICLDKRCKTSNNPASALPGNHSIHFIG